MKNKIILAGGSGFLGRALAKELYKKGHEPIILTRAVESYKGAGRAVFWDGKNLGSWAEEIEGSWAIVNLTGKNVKCRPTRRNEQEILSSRVNSVKAIGEALRRCETPPSIWVQTSSLAIYGNTGEKVCDEDTPAAVGFPANVCVSWEAALRDAVLPQMRSVILRIGFVIGRSGGALPVLERLTRLGLGGSLGSGKQWISWVHVDDMTSLFLKALEDAQIHGVYNVSGPEAVTNSILMRSLRKRLKRPWSPPVPKPLVWLGGILLDSDPRIALAGRKCVSKRLEKDGFVFNFPNLNKALDDLVG